MPEAAPRVVTHAAELRRDFDRSFAEMPSPGKSSVEDLLAIRLGVQDYALRLSEIAGLFAGKKITPVPGGHRAQLGIVGFPRFDRAGLRSPRTPGTLRERDAALAGDRGRGASRSGL